MTIHDRAERMRLVLEKALQPTELTIIDDSRRHARHVERMAVADKVKVPGAEGQTHYKMEIRSAKFDGLGRLARHRLVQDLLKTEFDTGLHALTLVLKGATEK
ncbi:BolA family transcriptional regulator [Acetobacteraceae bacterium ESL0709]|nr:BolA family transcriptional regulator [Acetobacteraceae bacterium ESL0697]MDF7678297.1 BolA family transcriptional regulator [Acetobacteraceae bacterium ESL0709]